MNRALFLALSLFMWSVAAEAAQFKVIVNRSVKADSLTRQQVSDLFLKKTTKWPDGTAAAPVDQPDTSAVREAFSKEILGKPVSAVKSYWNKQIFSGRDLPPLEKKTDAEVVAYVRANAGAIGYVANDTAEADGVRTVTVH
ncbi:MAG TPA: substrate-binding domain-containing protein [Thermoanaerobaculia bacterium]|nr:substrate-binding domain-containing protein [Thermoanaerobaculia bacterium]